MFHQNRSDGLYRSKKATVRYGSTDQLTKPATHHPAGKNVLQHRTPVISERLSKSAGFIDSSQSIQMRWDDFLFGVSPLAGVSYSRQSSWYLQAPPLRPAQATASRSYPEDYICHDDVNLQVLAAARTCRLPGFYFLIFIQEVLVFCFILSHSLPLFLLILSNNAPMNSAIPVLMMMSIVRTVPSLITVL